MAEKNSSKYILAIQSIGRPCSPRMIREEVNLGEDDDKQITAQNCASALNNLLSRGQIVRGIDGLYMTHEMAEQTGIEADSKKTADPI